ncbi:MAG: RecB-like helicase [Campylobacterales bacterium]
MKQFLALLASAGSGKTFALSVRYLALLFEGARPHEIVALTFTVKAATEMKERILSALFHLDKEEPSVKALREELCKELGIDESELFKRLPAIQRTILTDEITITTIDSFTNKILRLFCWYAGIRPDASITFDDEELLWRRYLVRLQQEPQAYETLLRVIAAWTKRQTEVMKLFKLLLQHDHEFTPPSSDSDPLLEAITQEETKINEIVLGLKQKFEPLNPSQSAINAFEYDTIAELAHKTWIKRDSLSDYKFFKKYSKSEWDSDLIELKKRLSHWMALREELYLSELGRLYTLFKEVRREVNRERNTLTFDDIGRLLIGLRQQELLPTEFLYFRLDARINHILIDEFQDTSPLQYELLRPLIEEILAGAGQHGDKFRTLFYVGDTKQSIYRFRGARSDLFDLVAKHYHIPLKTLTHNYRSAPVVLDFINTTFSRLYTNEGIAFEPQLQGSKLEGGYVEVRTLPEETPLEESIAAYTQQLINAGIPADKIALLAFTNDDLLRLEGALRHLMPDVHILTETSATLTHDPMVEAILARLDYVLTGSHLSWALWSTRIFGDPTMPPPTNETLNLHHHPTQLVMELIRTYNLENPNTLRLAELALKADHLAAFLDMMEDSSEPLIPGTVHGIRLMTIHKSKGLQFAHLIISDKLGGSNNHNDELLFDYEGERLSRVWLRMADRDDLDREYAQALGRIKQEKEREELNTLYVALTRAEKSLIILQKSKNSAFEKLGLSDTTIGTLHDNSPSTPAPEVKRLELTLPKVPRQEIDGDESYTPNDPIAIMMGSAFHLGMEHICLQKPNILATQLLIQQRFPLLSPSESWQITNWLRLITTDEQFINFINQATTYWRELPFCWDNHIGQIDLLLHMGTHLVVIDFKTTFMLHDSYRQQVKFYMNAIKEIMGLPTEGWLAMVQDEGVKWVQVTHKEQDHLTI